MSSFNKVILMGNLTRDPEVKFTPKGTAVCEISLAVNKTWKDESGQKRESVGFFGCNAWGRTAEVIGEHFRKGSQILIEGELVQETWEDKESGKKREKTKVRIASFQFVGGKRDNDEPPARPLQESRPSSRPSMPPLPPRKPSPPRDPDLDLNGGDDDIPFN